MVKPVCLVVPTIRENSFRQFIEKWGQIGLFDVVDLMIVEDNPTVTFGIPPLAGTSPQHFAWDHIEAELGDRSWIIPRRSDTVRSFGYYMAWKRGYQFVLTLDDDCYPPTLAGGDGVEYSTGAVFVQNHLNTLLARARWHNTLSAVKPRGIPFKNVGQMNTVMVNHGLWTNVLDYDAPTQLVAPVPEKHGNESRLVPHGQYFPMCGMNVMFNRNAAVLMYHLLMGQRAPQSGEFNYNNPNGFFKLPFDRFGDIWCGLIMKKILDSGGLHVATGVPHVRHERASDPFTNLKKEAPGLEVNEKLWEYIDSVALSGRTLPALYAQMGSHVGMYNGFPDHKQYFEMLGEAMKTWASLFGEIS